MVTIITTLYASMFYLAAAILIIGLTRKIVQYAKTPAPLKIPTTPAPTTTAGVVYRMAKEVIFFESLFKSTKWTWMFSVLFHLSLLFVLMRHFRYFIEPI